MEFSINGGSPEKLPTGCVVVGIFEGRKLTNAAERLDKAAEGLLTRLLDRGDFEGKGGTTLLLPQATGLNAERVLLVGLGKEKEFHEEAYRKAIIAAVRRLSECGATDALLCLTETHPKKRNWAWRVRQAVILASEVLYRFDQLKSKKEESPIALRSLALWVDKRGEQSAAERALREGKAIAKGMALMKDLANLPGNHCTPSYLADQAVSLAGKHGMEVDILDDAAMDKLGMNTLLAVARGSKEPPRFIVLKHHGGKEDEPPVVLVGKGITFDSGGISLKPGADMDEMKFDMSGAASVLGTMKAIAQLGLPLNVIGVAPCCENLPGGKATRPGDIVTSMSGQTIEILNTDAEGRLILCDALTYVERFKPACVIDIATLTGACVIALGHVVSGLLANDDELADEVLSAGIEAWDRAWRMPLLDEYQEQLKSNFADMANIGGRPAGTITAAAFLSRFTKKYPWAHLDIAGTAYKSGKEKGSTGRPVSLLTHFLLARAAERA